MAVKILLAIVIMILLSDNRSIKIELHFANLNTGLINTTVEGISPFSRKAIGPNLLPKSLNSLPNRSMRKLKPKKREDFSNRPKSLFK